MIDAFGLGFAVGFLLLCLFDYFILIVVGYDLVGFLFLRFGFCFVWCVCFFRLCLLFGFGLRLLAALFGYSLFVCFIVLLWCASFCLVFWCFMLCLRFWRLV